MSDDNKSISRGGSPEIDDGSQKAAYKPKFPEIKPSDVKLSKTLAKLMAGDRRQVALHKLLACTADKDNEHTIADHLQKVFNVLIENYPNNGLDKLEEVSYLIRKGQDMSQFLKVNHSRNYKEQAKDLASFIEKTMPLFVRPKPENEEEEVPETPAVCSIQDLLADQQFFQAAGIGFGQQELYLLQKSLQKLAASQQCSFIRFFGKIRGTQADYYVVEATAEGGEEPAEEEEGNEGAAEEKDPNQEEKGTGVNKYTYFVTNSPFSPWSRLPDLSPTQISAARGIKFMFSGNLESDIICNPFFFGKEKHLLRAQIARIVHSTALVPKGSYKLNEENNREVDEFVPEEESKVDPLPTTCNAAKLSAWVHFNASILNCNRTLHLDPPEEAPEGFEGEYDPEAARKDVESADPFQPRLKGIDGDEKFKMSGNIKQAPWVIRLVGDSYEYANEQGKKICHGFVVVRSLTWPGSYTLYQNGQQKNIYVGEGIKFSDKLRPFPLAPPVLNLDPVEYGEFVLPEVKVFMPEEVAAKVNECFDEIWAKFDAEGEGLSKDDFKVFVSEMKARLHGKEEPMDVVEDEFAACTKDIEDKITKENAHEILINKLGSL